MTAYPTLPGIFLNTLPGTSASAAVSRASACDAAATTTAVPTALDIFVGGFLDKYTGLVIGYQRAYGEAHLQRNTCYFEHHQGRGIFALVTAAKAADPQLVVNLVGHSWGAATAIRVSNALARRGCDVDLLITIDPVCRKKLAMESATTRWVNVNAAPATSNGWRGDRYASLGGKWGNWPARCNARHCDAPFHHNEFATLFHYAPAGASSALAQLLQSSRPSQAAA